MLPKRVHHTVVLAKEHAAIGLMPAALARQLALLTHSIRQIIRGQRTAPRLRHASLASRG